MKKTALIMEFCAGLTVSVVCFYLVPESVHYGSPLLCAVSVLGGVLLSLLIQETVKYRSRKSLDFIGRLRASGYTAAVINIIGNIPEGIIFGTGFGLSPLFGLRLSIALLIHNLPENMSVLFALKSGRTPKTKIICVILLSLISTVFGLRIGIFIGHVPSEIMSAVMAFVAGTMLYGAVGEIMPESKRIYSGRLSAVFNIVGMAVGAFLAYSY